MSNEKDERSNELHENHNKGEQDGANNVYEPPNSALQMVWPTDEKIEENEAYDKGFDNGYKQR